MIKANQVISIMTVTTEQTNWLYYQNRLKHNLKSFIEDQTVDSTLKEAILYSSLNGGKCLRPLLCYAVANDFNLNIDAIDAIAIAVECIHAYSLIHDDLPAMDDDNWRRNQPSCHKKFPEFTAILAGNALQSMAFAAIAYSSALTPSTQIQCIRILHTCTGAQGLLLGQNYDLTTPPVCEQTVTDQLKTAKLFEACLNMSYHCQAKLCQRTQEALILFANQFGLAFQRQDDAFDNEHNHPAAQAFSQALQTLKSLGLNEHNSQLTQLTQLIQTRKT